MRKTIVGMACVAVLLLLGSCKYRGGARTATTATDVITAPKAPQPPPANSDDALTQTVDIEDSRSEAEGGDLTEKANVKTDTAVAGARTGVVKQKAPARKRK